MTDNRDPNLSPAGSIDAADHDWSYLHELPLPSPCWVVDELPLRRNLEVLGRVRREAGCKILLALKGFAMFGVFDLIRQYLCGVTASGPDEARLGAEEFGREVHVYAPAYSEQDMRELVTLADHIIFNSFAQWRRYQPMIDAAGRNIETGLRMNPRYGEVEVDLYNPCAPASRLGIPRDQFDGEDLSHLAGLHFHALCEQGSDVLERTLMHVERQFGEFFPARRWVNFGGGHHITRGDYDVDRLIRLVRDFRARYGVEVYLEPGEAVALNAGVLVTTVLDIVHNELPIAILDTSAAAHMPDVLEMPYRPVIVGGGQPGETAHTYRLGGLTCLAGDVIGDWSFDRPLRPGDRLIFLDMAHYTMVKTTTFNGVRLPSIAVYRRGPDRIEVLRRFGYEDFRNRLS